MKENSQKVINFRNFVFGVEDSLVSTVGLLSGIASASVPKGTIFLTGVILILVEAISMAAGSFLSERSTEDLEAQHEVSPRKSIIGSITMFFSYLIAGIIPLLPYSFLEISLALPLSILFTLIALFVLGLFSAKISHTPILKSAIRMLVIAGIAILVGVIVGKIFNHI
ncbi:MAG: VIT1/CCC1 transporter family protein [Patescibacteria group bacterium]